MRVLPTIILTSLLSPFALLPSQSQQENWRLCKSQDDVERSIAACSALIQSNQETSTDLAKAHHGRASAYAHRGDYDRAIEDYTPALRITPNHADAFYGRGWAYAHKGDYDHAIQDFDQALRLNPNDADAYYSRGFAYGQKGDDDRAIRDYDQAVRLNPTYSAAFFNRSKAYAHKGDYLRAMADRGHFVWLKFGILGITIRLFLSVAVAVALGFTLKRFRRDPNLAESRGAL